MKGLFIIELSSVSFEALTKPSMLYHRGGSELPPVNRNR